MRPTHTLSVLFRLFLSVPMFIGSLTVVAQVCPTTATSSNLICVIPQLYSPGGLILPNTHHAAHFQSASLQSFSPLNTAIGQELSTLPLASPGSSIVFSFDKSLGVMVRSATSFGPILSERAETIGRHSFYIGATYQYFKFSSLDGINLNSLPADFKHVEFPVGGTIPQFEHDWIETSNRVDLKVHEVTLFGTFGLTSRIDVSVAVPIFDIRMGVTSHAHIVRTDPCELNNTCTGPLSQTGNYHFFDANDPLGSTDKTFFNSKNASGIGDVVLRVKGVILSHERLRVGGGVDVLLPTGDEKNFLGSGAAGVKPFVTASMHGRVSPHLNLGYQWNGSSILAGNVLTGKKARMPDQFFYAAGVDVGVTKRVTAIADLIGERVFGASRLREVPFTDLSNTVHPDISDIQSFHGTFDAVSISPGAKIRLVGNLLLSGNVLVRLNHGGLRANVVPLVGLSYSF